MFFFLFQTCLCLFLRGGNFSRGDFSCRVVAPPPKIVINLPRTHEKHPVKENPIGSAVSEILQYKYTNTQTNILLMFYKERSFATDKKAYYFIQFLYVMNAYRPG